MSRPPRPKVSFVLIACLWYDCPSACMSQPVLKCRSTRIIQELHGYLIIHLCGCCRICLRGISFALCMPHMVTIVMLKWCCSDQNAWKVLLLTFFIISIIFLHFKGCCWQCGCMQCYHRELCCS